MNYSGNMPDWHQFNASQTNEVTQSTQNVNSGHLAFIPGVSPPTLNALSLTSDGLNKHPGDSNYNQRSFQSLNNVPNGPNIPNNSPLTSIVQMQNCIGHYASPNTRNPVLDNLNTSVDPRNNTLANINTDLGYRSNQVPFNGPIGHLSGPNCNLNASSVPGTGSGSRTNSGPVSGTSLGSMFGSGLRHGSVPGPGPVSGSVPTNMGPRNTNMGSVHTGKSGPPSFISCKGLCCNSDPNINYQQWEKFGSYQNNTSYRDNIHPSSYQMENRHYGNNCNFRKDNLEGKEAMGPVLPNGSAMDHRRNFSDYKYHKDHLVHRNYSASTGTFHNYPMQNYNYSTEHQKYPYPVKEHPKSNNMGISNSGMLKHQEQNYIAQQKFNNTQYQYQSGNMLPKAVPTLNVNTNMASSMQNPYFNSQFPRNVPTEMSHECHETTDNSAMVNRLQNTYMHNSPPQHQMYQHKIAVQKFAMENHLREFSKIPGYQSHPKYKECVLRYRELLKLQQTVSYQNPVQQTPRVETPVSSAVVPINLQFDQNGMLINSNYVPDTFPKLQHIPTTKQSSENMEKHNKDQPISMPNEKQAEQLVIPPQRELISPLRAENTLQKQNQYSVHKDFNQNQLKLQTNERHNFDTLNTDTTNKTMIQQKSSKEFANKPDLDVRQFLANWDETDDEEGTVPNLPGSILNETTPVMVVSYENVDVSSNTPQDMEITNRSNFCSNEITLNNEKESETNVVAAQDCLTISYSSENAETTKTSKQTISEGVVKPGSIIHCISNGPDEIPTIHIVDNLEISSILGASNSQVIETIGQDKALSFFRGPTNSETEAVALQSTDQHEKDETSLLSDNFETPLNVGNKNVSVEIPNNSQTIQTTVASINNQELRVLSASGKNNNVEVSENLELKKQSSFASEESHNPDDISLPDLPTSECTPISTTLNTPIHSDSEESSENIEDFSMSTNPIEVMQNSPVISFTQSPVKIDPYEQMNNEDKLKNRSLGMLELEFQKDNRYKNTEANNSNEQDVNLKNFDFSAANSTVKSSENVKGKLMKSLGNRSIKDKMFLVNGKENDAKISESCAALSSIEYELEVQQDTVEGEKNSECDSSSSTHEGRHKGFKKTVTQTSDSTSIDTIAHAVASTVSNVNFPSPIESDDEIQTPKHDEQSSKQQKITNLNITINTNQSGSDLNIEKKRKGKEAIWEDTCIEGYFDKNVDTGKSTKFQRRDVEHLKQSKKIPTDDSSPSQNEQFVCHMTSQYKNYSVAVMKDNIALSDKKSVGIAGLSRERMPEVQSRTNNTKEFSEEAESRKHVSNKISSSSQENIHSRKSELLQKDLKIVDGDIRYTKEEMKMLKEYSKRRDAHDERIKSKECTNKKEGDENNESLAVYKVCLEQNVSSINSSPENSGGSNASKKHGYLKSINKAANSDFGIHVANVNLKIKDNDIGKELSIREKGQEHIKDSLEDIKMEINVSCTDRNSRDQEQSKRIAFENVKNADNRHVYEINDCFNNTMESSKILDKSHKISEKFPMITDIKDTGMWTENATTSSTLKKSRKNSLDANEDFAVSVLSKEACNFSSESQALDKLLYKSVSSKNTSKNELIEGISSLDDRNIIKSKCAISNTAVVDTSNKILIRGKNTFEDEREDSFVNTEDVRVARVQKLSSTNCGETSSQRSEEKDVATASYTLKQARKLLDTSLVELNTMSLNSLSTLDLKFDKTDYRRCPSVSFDQAHIDDLGEFDDSYSSKWKKPKIDHEFEDCDMFQSTSGYINPIFSNIDKLEDLHTVPIYTTKDGKISYSPNRRYTYHELMMEERKRESSSSTRRSHYVDAWNSYYNIKFCRLYKKKRHQGRKKHDYKDMKYFYDRKSSYLHDLNEKNHGAYKDYVHGIKSNNAAWLEHCRMEKIYSSSDSDEEVVDRSKNFRKPCFIENKATVTSKSGKDETAANDLDLEDRDKESTTSGIQLCKNTQPRSPDGESCPEECQKNNDSSSVDAPQTNTTPDRGTCANTKESATRIESCNIVSEYHQSNENKLSTDGNGLNTHKTEKCNNTLENVEEIDITNGLLNSKLLNEVCSLNKSEGGSGSQTSLEKCGNDERNAQKNADCTEAEEVDTKIHLPNSQTSDLGLQNHSEKTDNNENDKNLVENQTKIPESEIDEVDHSLTKEVSKLHGNVDNNIVEISEASLEIEKSNEVSIEVIERVPPTIDINNVNENSKYEQASMKCLEQATKLDEKQKHDRIDNKEIEKNKSAKLDNDNNLLEKNANVNNEVPVTIKKKSESRTVQQEETNGEHNGSECVSIETIERNESTRNSDQIDTVKTDEDEDLVSTNILNLGNDNITSEDSAAFDKNGIETVLENVSETSIKNVAASLDDSGKNSNESDPDELQSLSEPETNLSGDSSLEKDMPVLSMYCTIKTFPNDGTEEKENETDDQKEKQCNSPSLESHQGANLLSESNKDIKVVPKLVIKKTDTLSSKSECSLDSAEPDNSGTRFDAKITTDTRPKIPKMIIMKNRSRSATPTTEILEKTKSQRTQSLPSERITNTDAENSDSELYTLKYNDYETKVPKVRIKLEDISSKDLRLYLKRKAAKSVPKMKIKRIKTQLSEQEDRSLKCTTEDHSETDSTDTEEDDIETKMKLKRREEDRTSSPDRVKGRDTSVSRTLTKRTKKTKEDDIKYDNVTTDADDLKKKLSQSITDKIPKVIIKRTQIGTEFKCEISKSTQSSLLETSKWQPKVKLQRLQVLDRMVKELKQTTFNINDPNSSTKLFRSNSATSLCPIKCKQRRLSNPDYLKKDAKLASTVCDNDFDLILRNDKYKLSEVENKSPLRKSKTGLFSQGKYNAIIDDSDDDINESISSIKNSVSTVHSKEDDDSLDKISETGTVRLDNLDDLDYSIIKVDSSDDSETTIEILSASPDTNDDETKNCKMKNVTMHQMEDAMPTQLALELELMDNKNTQCSDTVTASEGTAKTYFSGFQSSSQKHSFTRTKYTAIQNERKESPEKRSKDYFYSDDLLVKEVLAAKETLKKCLAKSENDITDKNKSRPKTVAEKKQGLCINFKEFDRLPSNSVDVHDTENCNEFTMHTEPGSIEKKECKVIPTLNKEETSSEQSKNSSIKKIVKLNLQDGTSYNIDCPTASSTCEYNSASESTIISLKATKKFGRIMTSEKSSNIEATDMPNKNSTVSTIEESNGEKSENNWANSRINQKSNSTSETKTKEDIMPLLVPETALNFDSSSDRDSSRSPPVITNQENLDSVIEGTKLIESKVISQIEKVNENNKQSYKDCELTIADIIAQLAYHEKATIKHRRYCNLCERWFPTTSRHRRHLAGYQHRYMELTQRKSIHALFILFTGKPCPRLLPANVIRNDCSIGELTPLQIAVQDIAKCAEHAQQNLKKKE